MFTKDLWVSALVFNIPRCLLHPVMSFLMVRRLDKFKLLQLLTILEPGFYEDGKFGIRIESKSLRSPPAQSLADTDPSSDIIMAREVQTNHNFGDKTWLGFEHVTMTPIDNNLIEPSLLSDVEIEWVNKYHAEIWEKTHHFFEHDEYTRNWLQRKTQPISK